MPSTDPFTTVTAERYTRMQDAITAADELVATVKKVINDEVVDLELVEEAISTFNAVRAKL